MSEPRWLLRASSLMVVLALTGCSTAPAPFEGSPTRGQMVAHFDLAVELRGHAVRGDLQRFRTTAQALADLDPARDLPSDVILQLGPMRWEAQAGASARTNEAAAQAAAEVARTCGDCHQANGVELLTVQSPGAELLEGDMRGHMAGLAWVTNLLWDGLVGPSQASWNLGAEELGKAGVLPDALLEAIPERDVRFASDRLRRLALEAAQAHEPDYRVRALGEIWATCSECHISVR